MSSQPHRTKHFLSALSQIAPAYSHHVSALATDEPGLFSEFAEPMLEWAELSIGENYLEKLIDGYVFFVTEVNTAQIRYEKTGKYQFQNFNEVFDIAYGDDEFMDEYHWGVFTSTFAWQHHLYLARMFRDKFLAKLAPDASILDLGAGSGIYNLFALHHCPKAIATAVDISPKSTQESRNTAQQLNFGDRTTHVCADAMTWQADIPFDAAISCFVLEHLESPELLLSNLRKNVKPHGYVYITTALTASEVDHIFEFRRESEVVQMCESAGFRVIEYQSLAPESVPEDRYFLPRSIGLLLQVRKGLLW